MRDHQSKDLEVGGAVEGSCCENTDRHLWPQTSAPDAPYEALFVTREGSIGINIQGNVIVKHLREWHRLAGGMPGRGLTDPLPSNQVASQLRVLAEVAEPEEATTLSEAADEIERLRAELDYIGRLCPYPDWSNRARKALRPADETKAPLPTLYVQHPDGSYSEYKP